MNICLRSISFALGALLSASASAQQLSEPQIFNRCYTQLTGHAVPLNHAVMKLVKTGKISGVQACANMLDKTELDAGSGMLLSQDAESQWILNNFYTFHRSWFPGNTTEQIAGITDEVGMGTRDVYDSTEPSLALTRSVFKQNAKYSEVLTDSMGVHGIRREDPAVRSFYGFNVTFPGRRVYGNNPTLDANIINFSSMTLGYSGRESNAVLMTMPKIEVGELVGIRSTTESFMVPNVAAAVLTGTERKGNNQPGLNYTYNFYQTMGGGVLGTPIYLMMNFGHPLGLEMNGSIKLPRRWAQTNMTTFMCATLPALREADVRQFVVGNSTAPFRNASSCVMCHANLDQMAYTARNAEIVASDYFVVTDDATTQHAKVSYMLANYRAEIGSVAGWPSEPVANFHRQTPSGKLYYRSFTGELVNKDVTGISGLGQAMVQTDDYYQCAAKRYFQFLTGIEVALYDRQDPRYSSLNQALSKQAITDRQYIENLASSLRQTQSVKSMIKTILGSDYYKSAKFRP